MFHRRRAASNPAPKSPPSAAASLAASQAFLQNRNSHASLSSAAAAAALRTHPAGPTAVGEVVTRRMIRKGSTSSHGSGSLRGPPLQRRLSSGSMTERSFRAPSPNRSSPIDPNAPPVPSIPVEVPAVSVVHRRASSLEPAFRGGSPRRVGGRGVSLDRAVQAPAGRARGLSLSQVPETVPESGTRSSINFSRPISPPQSPHGWFTGPVVTDQEFRGGNNAKEKQAEGLPEYEVQGLQHSIHNAANRPVSTKKNKLGQGVEGARLAAGTMGSKPSGSAVPIAQTSVGPSPSVRRQQPVDPKSPLAVYDPSTRTFISKQEAMARFRELDQYYEGSPEGYVPIPEPIPAPVRRVSQKQHTPVARVPSQPKAPQKPSPLPGQSPEREAILYRKQSPPRALQQGGREPDKVDLEDIPAHIRYPRTPTPPSEVATDVPGVLPRRISEDYAEADQKPSRETSMVDSGFVDEPRRPVSPSLDLIRDTPHPELEHTSAQNSKEGPRAQSLSPPRFAHFAPVAVEFPEGTKHQPPGRSVSPAKSALKSSPSQSRRSNSPMSTNGQNTFRIAPSETSDTMSDDGLRKKKKKSVRVSFDEEPVVAGRSSHAEITSPASPSGLGASRWNSQTSPVEEHDFDEIMKPRAALPSFGSIRNSHRRHESDQVAETKTASVGPLDKPLEASKDDAIGGLLAQHFASRHQEKSHPHQEPLPPEVTSVEGSGYVSDSDQSYKGDQSRAFAPDDREADIWKEAKSDLEGREPKALTGTVDRSNSQELGVPAISILPATPSATEGGEPRFDQSFGIPGGWNEVEQHTAASSPQAGTSNDVPQVGVHDHAEAHVAETHDQPSENSSDEDSSSIYSDAYEDLSDVEDGGFASIDALMESSMAQQSTATIPPAQRNSVSTSQANNIDERPNEIRNEETARSGPRDTARPYGGEFSNSEGQERRIKGHEHSIPASVASVQVGPIQQQPQSAAARDTKVQSIQPAQTIAKSPQDFPVSTQPRKSALKKTVSPPPETSVPAAHIRTTMRDNTRSSIAASPEPRMRKSMRGEDPTTPTRATSGLAASRHSMPHAETRPQKGALQKKHMPAAAQSPKTKPQSAAGAALAKAAAIPAPTYDSDSDASASSFVRERRKKSSKGGDSYTMRRSMRESTMAAGPRMRAAPSVKPISPPVGSPPPTLRKSMRAASPEPSSPMRSSGLMSSRFSIRSLSPAGRKMGKHDSFAEPPPPLPVQTPSPKGLPGKLGGFGKASKSKSKAPAGSTSKSRFKSRFEDSSDEEDDRPRRFQSRFADSDSDEDFELPPGLAPVRGIPRRSGEEDAPSTDLEDEDSDGEPAIDVEKSPGRITNGAKHASFAPTSLRQSMHAPDTSFESVKKPKAKRGFLGLGKKKSPSQVAEPEPAPVPMKEEIPDIPLPPPARNRPLTPIGEDDDKAIEVGPSDTRSPKLQRRNTPQWGRSTSDSWPLPQTPPSSEPGRPQTSDGAKAKRTSMRPTFSKRHSSVMSESSYVKGGKEKDEAVPIGKNGKKKKFPKLRRMFGLTD
ncbi:hypothetical protein GQ43DRAFT_444887 [Delitschia confertaspora ATCC 74209]|uniref:Uncharacterized protein n=1 Tax=Delitschia confertaspora ATCC 74209 TaxID=1513339 RepID=A0A9P4JE89_9PLEO|nr:hypothetical protein GQ43DRAFT_444887 [Delitschia confertaspora ATCC 74209]